MMLITTSLDGLHFMVVESGTIIRDERSGEEAVITDTEAAKKGSVVYCTQAVFDSLKEKIDEVRSRHPNHRRR